MAIFKSTGIIFKSTKYSESSLILDIYTREKGMRSFIVSGVRSSKAKKTTTVYAHLNIVDLVAYDKLDALARIKECSILHYYKHIPFDVARSSIGLFLLEICKNSIREKEQNTSLFDYIFSSLQSLDSDNPPNLALFNIKFILKMSTFLGIQLYNNYSSDRPYLDLFNGKYVAITPERYYSTRQVSAAIAEIEATDFMDINQISYSKETRNAIVDDLLIYYRLHIDGFRELKTLEVLREIF